MLVNSACTEKKDRRLDVYMNPKSEIGISEIGGGGTVLQLTAQVFECGTFLR